MSFSKRKSDRDKAELTEKYGLHSIEALTNHLEICLRSESQRANLKKVQKLQDQIQYLKLEKNRFVKKQKNQIIQHIMKCIEEDRKMIVREFEEDRNKDLSQLIQEMKNIEQQMQIQHQNEMKKAQEALNEKLMSFQGKTSQSIMNYTKQLHELCKLEEYEQAEKVRLLLEKQFIRNGEKKYYEWKDHKDKQIKSLALKQQKQREGLRSRLQALLNEEVKSKNEDYNRLMRRFQVQKKKLQENLTKQHSFKKEIESLASSRFISRSTRKIQNHSHRQNKMVLQNQLQTGPSSLVHTYRCQTPDKKRRIQYNNI